MSISPAPQPGYTLAPPLAAKPPKAPWRPKAVASICFFFSPGGGAVVTAVSLRRMGHSDKAKKVLWVTALAAIPIGAGLMLIPEAFARFFGLGVEAAACAIFPVIQGKEFAAWEVAQPGTTPSSGWKAIGWGFLGLVSFVAIVFLVGFVVALLLPGLV